MLLESLKEMIYPNLPNQPKKEEAPKETESGYTSTMSTEEAKESGLRLVQPWVMIVVSVCSILLSAGVNWGITQGQITELSHKVDASVTRADKQDARIDKVEERSISTSKDVGDKFDKLASKMDTLGSRMSRMEGVMSKTLNYIEGPR